jgi:hypothetical protein
MQRKLDARAGEQAEPAMEGWHRAVALRGAIDRGIATSAAG